jgi:TAT (twin-arginine translocation) pathway signal sequence
MRIDKRSKQIHFSRRSMLKGAGATAGTLAVGSMLKGTVGSILNPSPVKASTFWKGADVSWMQQMAANGYSWKNRMASMPFACGPGSIRPAIQSMATAIRRKPSPRQ